MNEFYTQIYNPLKEKLLASRKRNDDSSDEHEDEAVIQESIDNLSPPGTAYVELLQILHQDVLPGIFFTLFIHFTIIIQRLGS